MRKFTLILTLLTVTIFADNIYFNNGDEIHNCQVLEQNQSRIRVKCFRAQGGSYVQVFQMNSIQNIKEEDVNSTAETKFLQRTNPNPPVSNNAYTRSNRQHIEYKFNWARQPFTILSAFIAWQNFHGLDEWKATGGALKDFKLSEDEWGDPEERAKIKRNVVFSVSAGLAIINFFSSFEAVEVQSTGNGVQFSYSF